MKLSVVISAYNEQDDIENCLKSVKDIADEIIVIDNSSTDNTVQIAKKYTLKIFKRENNPMLNINKNFGFSKAKSEWILNLDGDEQLTPQLAKEISEKIAKGSAKSEESINGYWIPRKNIIFGKWIEHTGWYPDYQMRLFRNGRGKFPEKNIHELIQTDGKTAHLTEPMIHNNYRSIHQFLNKFRMIYAPQEAKELIDKGYAVNYLDAIRFPCREFLSRFFLREGYKDGLHGLVLSILMGFYHFVVFLLIWEQQGFKEYNNKNFLNDVYSETKQEGFKFKYWFLTAFIGESSNTAKKFFYKTLRKKVNTQIKK